MDLEQANGKVFQTCLRDGQISEQSFDPERKRHHYGGRSSRQFNI